MKPEQAISLLINARYNHEWAGNPDLLEARKMAQAVKLNMKEYNVNKITKIIVNEYGFSHIIAHQLAKLMVRSLEDALANPLMLGVSASDLMVIVEDKGVE